MKGVFWIVRRELGAYLRSPMGYIIIAAVLVIDGLFFNAIAVGSAQRKSADVLLDFFKYAGGGNVVAAVFISMRLIAEERQTGTFVLLATSPLRDWQVVLGKYLGGLAFLALLTALTIYMPALVMLHGKISFGHLAAGYLGMMLIGGASLAIGLLCSALSPNQLVAVILAAAVNTVFVLLWLLSKIASPPLESILSYLSLHDKHFLPFMRGLISLQDVVFYVSLIYVALVASTRALETRRWR